MDSAIDGLPPLPPGFVLQQQSSSQANGMPPLPPGFVLQSPSSPQPGRLDNIKAADSRYLSGNQSLPGATADIMAQGAGAINDLASIPLKAAGKAAEYIAPETSKYIEGKVSDLAQSAPVQSALNKLNQFKQNHPDLAHYVGDAAEILSAIPAVKGAGLATKAVEGATSDAVAGATNLTKQGLKGLDVDQLRENAADIFRQGSEGFKDSDAAGGTFKQDSADKLVSSLEGTIKRGDTKSGQLRYKDNLDAIAAFKDDIKNGNTGLQTLHDARQNFSSIARNFTSEKAKQEASKASEIIDIIDKFTDGPGRKAISNPAAIDSYDAAMTQWAKGKTYEKIVDIVQNADGDPDKISKAIKTMLGTSKSAKKAISGFNGEEKVLLQKAKSPSGVEKLMAALGKFGIGKFDAYHLATPAGAAAVAGHFAGGPAALGVAGLGTAAKYGSKIATQGRVNNVLDKIMERGAEASEEWDTTKDIRAAEPQKLLAAPKKEFLAYSDGVIRDQTQKELSDAIANRGKYSQLGMSPDIQKRIFEHEIRNKFKDVWSDLDGETKQKVKDQVDKAWADHKKSLHDIVKNSVQSIQGQGDTYAPTVMSQAMMQAKGLK